MKKAAIVSLSIIVIAAAIIPGGMAELCKLPSLLHHYAEHKQNEQQNLSFTQFLAMHYAEDSAHRTQENHEDLPLYHSCCNTVTLFVFNDTLVELGYTTEQIITYQIEAVNHYQFNTQQRIFQPPRLV